MPPKEIQSRSSPRDPNDKAIPNVQRAPFVRPPQEQFEGCTSALTKFGRGNQRVMPDPYPGMNRAPRRDEAAFTQHPFKDPETGRVSCARRQVYDTRTSRYVVSSETFTQ